MRNFAIAIGSPDEALAIGSEHGEAVEVGMECDAVLVGAVFIDDVEIEVAAILGVVCIGGKDEALAIGKPVGGEIRGAIVSDLMLMGAVGVHDPDFEIAGTDKTGGKQVLVILHFFRRFGMFGAIDDFLAVVGPEGAAVVAELVGKLLHVGAVGIHGEDVEVAVARGGEYDVLAVASNRGLGVVAFGVGQRLEVGTIGSGGVDLIGVVDRPDVTARIVGFGRTFETGSVGRRKQDAVAGGKKVAAGGAAFAGADEFGSGGLAVGSVNRHGVDLIAGDAIALMLKDELLVIGGEI